MARSKKTIGGEGDEGSAGEIRFAKDTAAHGDRDALHAGLACLTAHAAYCRRSFVRLRPES